MGAEDDSQKFELVQLLLAEQLLHEAIDLLLLFQGADILDDLFVLLFVEVEWDAGDVAVLWEKVPRP